MRQKLYVHDRDYPAWVCFDCGHRYGRGAPNGHMCTVHQGVCGICKEARAVTEPRDFGHLVKDWKKLVRASNARHNRPSEAKVRVDGERYAAIGGRMKITDYADVINCNIKMTYYHNQNVRRAFVAFAKKLEQ